MKYRKSQVECMHGRKVLSFIHIILNRAVLEICLSCERELAGGQEMAYHEKARYNTSRMRSITQAEPRLADEISLIYLDHGYR